MRICNSLNDLALHEAIDYIVHAYVHTYIAYMCVCRTAVKDRIVAFLLFLGKVVIVCLVGKTVGDTALMHTPHTHRYSMEKHRGSSVKILLIIYLFCMQLKSFLCCYISRYSGICWIWSLRRAGSSSVGTTP